MTGRSKQNGKAVDILTKGAIYAMIIPSSSCWLLLSPICNLLISGDSSAAFTSLGAMLLGTIVTVLFVAISMTSEGRGIMLKNILKTEIMGVKTQKLIKRQLEIRLEILTRILQDLLLT